MLKTWYKMCSPMAHEAGTHRAVWARLLLRNSLMSVFGIVLRQLPGPHAGGVQQGPQLAVTSQTWPGSSKY